MEIGLGLAALAGVAASGPAAEAMDSPLAPTELAEVHGTFVPPAGLDLADAAANASALPAPLADVVSNQMRDVFDNWNLDVAAPLISAATNAAVINQ